MGNRTSESSANSWCSERQRQRGKRAENRENPPGKASTEVQSIKLFLRHNRPWSWILWHPHQGLYNWALLKAIKIPLFSRPRAYRLATRTVIFIDTVILFLRALGRRVLRVGVTSLVGTWRLPNAISVLYLDLGTHKEAKELTLMVNEILPRIADNFDAYGFEASEEFVKQARARFVGRKNVHLIHGALCHLLPSDGTLKLYKDAGDGLENSLYRSHFAAYEEVGAIRLSDWLRDNHLDLLNTVCLLRMNIEGAEFDVVADLVASGLARCVDGYLGMWDDLSKIDKQRDKEFRMFLTGHHIFPFTFNGRDLVSRFRMRCIEYEIGTSVRAGLDRIRSQEPPPAL